MRINEYLIKILRAKLGRQDGRLESLLINKSRSNVKELEKLAEAIVDAFIDTYGKE